MRQYDLPRSFGQIACVGFFVSAVIAKVYPFALFFQLQCFVFCLLLHLKQILMRTSNQGNNIDSHLYAAINTIICAVCAYYKKGARK